MGWRTCYRPLNIVDRGVKSLGPRTMQPSTFFFSSYWLLYADDRTSVRPRPYILRNEPKSQIRLTQSNRLWERAIEQAFVKAVSADGAKALNIALVDDSPIAACCSSFAAGAVDDRDSLQKQSKTIGNHWNVCQHSRGHQWILFSSPYQSFLRIFLSSRDRCRLQGRPEYLWNVCMIFSLISRILIYGCVKMSLFCECRQL